MNPDAEKRQQLQSKVAFILSLGEAQVAAMVPVAGGGVYFTSCPNCAYGAEEAGCFNETWDPRHPGRLMCKGCGAVFPDNPAYPDDRFIEIAAPGGAVHRLYYYERPEDGYRFWFRAHADYWAREYLEAMAEALGELYRLTGDDIYARRAALILNRFADVFPGYVHRFDYPFRQKQFAPYTQNRIPGIEDYRTARWTWWAYMDIPLELIRAYDGIRDWPGWSAFSDGRQRLQRDFFVPLIEFVLGFTDSGTNMSMGMWRSAIVAGRVLGRPDWVHESVRRFEKVLATKFLYDGHWMETADSYAAQTQGGLQVVMDAAQGYTDPPGYIDPVDGRRFEHLDLWKLAPDYEVAEQTIGAVRLPDNRLLPLNDTWAVHGKTSTWRGGKPRERTDSVLLPATGIAVLGGGTGEHQLHACLNYTMGRHHKHKDALSIGLWAYGYELLSDIGYTWTNYRLHWPTTTMSHNTVVVDGVDSQFDPLHTGHKLLAYASDGAGFHLASAQSDTAYAVTSRYRRTLCAIGADSRDAYLIDIFEVSGGQQHDYLLHGCRDADALALAPGTNLQPHSGTLLNADIAFASPQSFQHPNPPGFGFGFIRDLRHASVGDTATLDFRLVNKPHIGTRTLMAGLNGAGLFAGCAPDIRRARETNANLDKTHAPVFCVRRRGRNLNSVFMATHEPVQGEPTVQSLSVYQTDRCLLLCIDRGEKGTDYFYLALETDTKAVFDTPHGSLEVKGRCAWLRLDVSGVVHQARLFDGSHLKFRDLHLKGHSWSGTVQSRDAQGRRNGSRGSFVVDHVIESADAKLFKLTFGDGTVWPFNVVEIESIPGGSRIHVREKPAFEIANDKIKLTSFPQREIDSATLHVHMPQMISWGKKA